MQSKCPTKRILIGKKDLDAAYRRIPANTTTVLTYIAILDYPAFLWLLLPFGTTPAQTEYMTVSDVSIDQGNYLLRDESSCIDDLNLPHQYLLPPEEKQHSTIHLETADPLAADITATGVLMVGFIDNIITITVDDKHWIDCAKVAALLVIYKLFWPLHLSEPLKQDDPLPLEKLVVEEKIAEHKTCLVWDIKTHYMIVFLPK